jgi:5'-3' exonuclease
MILDTASLYYRSYYALPSSMTAPDGHPHNAIRGLLQTIERLRERFNPTTLIAAWDTDWRPDWRVDLVPSYKTHRVAEEGDDVEDEPDDLGPQIGGIHTILNAWGVPVVGVEGFEADDVAGTLAEHARRRRLETVLVTGDRDFVQLVDAATRVLMTVKGGMEAWPLLDAALVEERYGVSPEQYLDVAVLRGDPSDGLPGVKGVGEKTAVGLIRTYGSLDRVRQACGDNDLDELMKPLTPRIAGLIEGCGEYLDAATTVTRIRRDVPILNIEQTVTAPIPRAPVDLQTWEMLIDEWGVRRFAQGAVG